MQPLCHSSERMTIIILAKFLNLLRVDSTMLKVRATIYCESLIWNILFGTLLMKYIPNSLIL